MSSHAFSKFFGSLRSKNAERPADSSEVVLTAKAVDDVPASVPSDSVTDPALIAVISAAVAAILSESSPFSSLYPGFRVRRIKRLQ